MNLTRSSKHRPLSNKSALLVFGEDWGRHPSSTQHIVREILSERQVIWVNSIGLRRPNFNWRDSVRLIEKFKQWWHNRFSVRSNASDISVKNLHIITPLVFPAARSMWLRKLNVWLVNQQIKRARQALNIKSLDLWLSLPTAVDWIGTQGEGQSLYYCGDDFSALAGVDHQHVHRCETSLLKKVDIVCAASKTIQQNLQGRVGYRKCVQLLPHGVDIRLFSAQNPRPEQLPADKPIAGFYGSIASWLDVDLLKSLAQSMPQWRFVLIGKIETDVGSLRQLDNIHFVPALPHHQLPAYVQHWQAAILPFKDCAQIQACDPLKLREYLASGTPVISSPFPALNQYRNVVQQASSLAQWQQALGRCYQPVSLKWRRHQQLMVAADGWNIRARKVSQLLHAC